MGEPVAPTRRRRWARRLAVLAVLAVGLFAARRPLLRGYAGLFVAEDAGGPADAILLGGGADMYDEAVRLYRAGGVGRVLVGVGAPERVAALGLVPDRATVIRDKLVRLGVPATAVTFLGRPDRDAWECTRRLGDWLAANPGATVLVTCPRYNSRRQRLIADRVLGPDAGRVRVRPLPYRRFGDGDWWHTIDGRRATAVSTFALVYALVAGERTTPYQDWNPDAYEAALR